jgi:hypothetical protein
MRSRERGLSSAAQQGGEARVAVGREPLARAILDDPSLLQDHDVVAPSHGLEAVRNDDSCPSFEESVDGALDPVFGCGVEPRRRFIEHNEPRVTKECAREREQLRLARRQAVRGHRRVEVSSRREPVAETEPVKDSYRPRVVDRPVEERDVVADRRVEELDVLGDEGRARADVREGNLARVDAAQSHRAAARVIET